MPELVLFHQAAISQNKCRYVQTKIMYEENEAIYSGIIFKGFTPIELESMTILFGPRNIWRIQVFVFTIIPCFYFMNVVEEPSLKGFVIS